MKLSHRQAKPGKLKGLVAIGAGVLVVGVASSALALEGRLVSLDSSGVVILWKSKDAMDEGGSLIRAKADVQIAVPLIACVAKSGTQAVSTIRTEARCSSAMRLLSR